MDIGQPVRGASDREADATALANGDNVGLDSIVSRVSWVASGHDPFKE
ncbi:MAG TPA: hypothetical protein VGD98_15285 [Ktedonobacteraceae bacterium]